MEKHKMFYTVFVLLFISFTAVAQQETEYATGKHKKKKHEISIGYGKWSPVQLLEGVHSGKGGFSETPVDKTSGIIAATYRYHITSWLFIGAGVAYENESGSWNTEFDWVHPVTIGNYKRAVFSIAPEVGFSYSHDKPVTTYGYLAVGGNYLNEVDAYNLKYYNSQYDNGINKLGREMEINNNWHSWAVQICPIGLSFGGRVRGFAELGFGYKGILNGGLSMHL